MSRDFEISHKSACDALGLQANALACIPLAYRINPDGSRVSWAADIARHLRLKYPARALAKMSLSLTK